jgi:hypothetical protein
VGSAPVVAGINDRRNKLIIYKSKYLHKGIEAKYALDGV